MRFVTRPVTIEVTSLILEDGTSIAESNLAEVLEALEDTDGVFDLIVIYDPNIAKLLEAEGAANRTSRGSHYKGPKFDAFRKKLDLLPREHG